MQTSGEELKLTLKENPRDNFFIYKPIQLHIYLYRQQIHIRILRDDKKNTKTLDR